MACEECARLLNDYKAAAQSFAEVVRGTSGLHGWDLNFGAATERSEKARHRLELCRAALREHEQHHKDIRSTSGEV
jgi:hypothetical protein